MKISDEVRRLAAAQGQDVREVTEQGMAEKAAEFKAAGAEVYKPL